MPQETIPFEMRDSMLHLRPATVFGNAVQHLRQEHRGIHVTLCSEDVSVDPSININILSENRRLRGNVFLVLSGEIDQQAFNSALKAAQVFITEFTETIWDQDQEFRIEDDPVVQKWLLAWEDSNP